MERPKRNMPKKWDPDFLSSYSSRDSGRSDKRLSLNPSELGEVAASSSVPSASKRAPRRMSAAPGLSLPDGEGLTGEGEEKTRVCGRPACGKICERPTCFVHAVKTCAGDGYTSRWYHISPGEHYCNDCFDHFYRSTKIGYKEFERWRLRWSSRAVTEANIRTFLVDARLPYWLQCKECNKWRTMVSEREITSDQLISFKCADAKKESSAEQVEVYSCEDPEDPIVCTVNDAGWISELLTPPYFTSCPSAPFLVNHYPDRVGLSASTTGRVTADKAGTKDGAELLVAPAVPGVPSYLQPFSHPDQPVHALALPPDHMTSEELQAFPQYSREQLVYVSVRNLIVALWNLNPKEALTVEQCTERLICRGLMRIRCVQDVPDILRYLTHMNYVNVGLFSGDLTHLYPPGSFQRSVVVVGAGAAGLGAARHLYNMGCQVTVLEARDRIGGRVFDDELVFGSCISRGAQVINACNNDPFALLTHQTDGEIYEMTDRCVLFGVDGSLIDSGDSRRMDFHFNMLLNNLSELKKNSNILQGISLEKKILEMHEEFIEDTQFPFTKEEESLIQFHLAHLEQSCGGPLDEISAQDWDHSESYPQFSGAPCFLPRGYAALLKHLSKDLDIRFNTQVLSIDYSSDNDRVEVVTFGDTHIFTDYVIVTVPLTVLRREVIKFNPPLPEPKQGALEGLGVGLDEKVAVEFSRCFWRKKTGRADVFGRNPTSAEERGLFTIFYDLCASYSSVEMNSGPGVLVSHLSGHSAKLIKNKSDKQIISMFTEALRNMFPEETIEEPVRYLVSRWQDDPHSGMSYSYLPVQASADMYDRLSECLDHSVCFAGEATNAAHPQTVTGAYLSGLREARKVLTHQRHLVNVS